MKNSVGKIVCVGRNYVEHALELQNKVPKSPFFFLKPQSSLLLPGNGPVLRPENVKLHYELELAVHINSRVHQKDPQNFTFKDALPHIKGYSLALDMTARNIQDRAKKAGLPWTFAKGFDTFLPISPMIQASKISDPQECQLKLYINDQIRQNDSTNLMIFKIPYLMAYLSNIMTLEEGDILLTGTPKGVGETCPGDKLLGELYSEGKLMRTLAADIESNKNFLDAGSI